MSETPPKRNDAQESDARSPEDGGGDVRRKLEELGTDPERGLDPDTAAERLREVGPNTIEEEDRNVVLKLLAHFWGPIPWMIEVAAVLAAIAQRWEDFGVIFAMLLINGGVSFWHESKADKAIRALKDRLSPEIDVVRGGETRTIAAEELVPGDLVILRMGDVVPADALLLPDEHLSSDESALTGESLPVEKEGGDGVWSGTSVKRGEARAVVSATGADTKFARTVELVEAAGTRSHFQKAVLRIGYFLVGVTALLVATIAIYATTVQDQPWVQVLLFALGLTLAGIPQALPAVLSVAMSVGASRLARKKAIVSRLAAMEEMAGLQVLCADKTGTLTRNELELQEPVLLEAEDEDDLVLAAALTCRREGDDPIDEAVLGGLDDADVLDRYSIEELRPFDPTRKRAEADVDGPDGRFSVAKGAPQAILALCEADDDLRDRVSGAVDDLGDDGFRALGVARRTDGGWHYLGLLSLLDPPREDSAAVIEDAKGHGVDIRMVTGDHAAIGRQVARQLGLGTRIVPADELFGPAEAPQGHQDQRAREVSDDVLEADGFAQVTPEHKFQIIRGFQEQDRIVGMTGDGVNDAPALQQADVGIAVASATDAARSASDLILTEPGLGVIVHAIEEARRIFERMIGYATFRITETMRVLLFVSLSILAFGFFPVTPIMIVLLAILNDIPIMTIAWDNARTARTPVRWDMRRVLTLATVLSIFGVAESLLLFWYAENHLPVSGDQIQTMMFLKLLVAGHLTIFLTRNEGWMWDRPWPRWILVVALEATQVVGTLFAVYGVLVEPIGWAYAGLVWGYAIVGLLLLNLIKVLTYGLIGHSGQERQERHEGEHAAQAA